MSKSKSPVSKKNRLINLGIDATTGVLIVGMFFFARYLRHLLPDPPPKAPMAATTPGGLTVSNSAAPASGPASAPAPADASVAASQPAPAASVTTSGASFSAVEAPGPSNTAEANLAGWIKPDNKPAAAKPVNQPPANAGSDNSSPVAVAPPAKVETIPPQTSPTPVSSVSMPAGQSAPANPAPVSMGDSLMSALSPSANAETIQPEIPANPTVSQTAAVPAARQPLKVVATVPAPPPAPLTEEQKLQQAAQGSFQHILEIAHGSPDTFGFASYDQIENTTLGEPIRIYTITESGWKNYQAGQPLKPLLKPTNQWIFPALLDNRVRFMVPVECTDGQYVAEAGSRSLAIIYEKIQARWPSSEGYHPQLVVNGNLDEYYFTIPELPDANLTDTGEMFDYNPTLSPASVIFASWR